MIFTSGNDIRQDNVIIGTYTHKQQAINGTVEVRYEIYDSYGNLVANAVRSAFDSQQIKITTAKDNRTHSASSSFSTDMAIMKEIAKVLIDKMYL